MIALTSSELLKQQLEEIGNKTGKEPKPVLPSESVAVEYNAALVYLIKQIKKDIDEEIIPLLKKLAPEYQTDSKIFVQDSFVTDLVAGLTGVVEKWTSPQFNQMALSVANRFIRTAERINRDRFNKSMKSFGLDIYGDSPAVQDYLDLAIQDNVNLITSIPQQYLERVKSVVMTNVRAGNRASNIVPQLQDAFGVTKSRAKLIARDQSAKLNGDLTMRRQTASGFEYFQWLSSKDERVRETHRHLQNQKTEYGIGIYRWDEPPRRGGSGSGANQRIIPGSDYQCRCTARPIRASVVEQNKREGLTKKG
jgi:SPP1 gp7 family putative phage head morphogenesis protein